ncbi:hypothetical protein Y032_0056g2652 [Ancylostoma ceylanicum]|uniref:Uncharacterized protein n=1 Tax=Ancylostoma ceylanicum TaxID=53326 RepID=A0A016U6P0_9BILA|nr:hypothetical protein Y032_0056g2652 [Ancylostoma ceylanicum]
MATAPKLLEALGGRVDLPLALMFSAYLFGYDILFKLFKDLGYERVPGSSSTGSSPSSSGITTGILNDSMPLRR